MSWTHQSLTAAEICRLINQDGWLVLNDVGLEIIYNQKKYTHTLMALQAIAVNKSTRRVEDTANDGDEY